MFGMQPVTYSLKLDKKDSEHYYLTIRKLTDEVLLKAKDTLLPIVDNYISYLKVYKLEEVREREEYLLELLSFGILWRTYSPKALRVKHAPFITMAKMGEWRKKYQRIKPLIDFARGILISFYLLPETKNSNDSSVPTLTEIDRVCLWFEATGEFREQALRFIMWRAYWGTLDEKNQKMIFGAIAEFRKWFENRTNEILGRYTTQVDEFLNSTKKKYLWREDRISCTRSRIEYHLNMVGAEMMNRAFRKEFLQTDATAVLIPGCMRARSKDECEAKKEKKGLKCIGCEPKCKVNHLRIHGSKNNYEVFVIPHASDLSLWTPEKLKQNLGVVASACVTTLVEGGWELKRYGVPAQCVLLDYCGCQKHWHPSGIPTEISKKELERIISKHTN